MFRPKSSQLASADASAAPPVCSESSPVLEWHWACVVPDTSCCFWPCYSVSVLPHLPLTPSLATSRIQIVAVHSPSALCKVLLTLPSFAVLCSVLLSAVQLSLGTHLQNEALWCVCSRNCNNHSGQLYKCGFIFVVVSSVGSYHIVQAHLKLTVPPPPPQSCMFWGLILYHCAWPYLFCSPRVWNICNVGSTFF